MKAGLPQGLLNIRLSHSGVFLALALLVHLGMAIALPGAWNAPVAGLLYGIAYVRIYRKTPSFALLMAPICLLHVSMLVSLTAVEAGARMPEIGFVGAPSAASALYAVVCVLFLSCGLSVYCFVERRLVQSGSKLVPTGVGRFVLIGLPLAFGVLAIIWLTAKGVRTGFPLLAGIDRLTYRAFAGDFLTINLLTLKIVVAAFLGVAAARCLDARLRGIFHLVFACYLFTSFLFGDKFFIIISTSFIYVATQVLDGPVSLVRRAKALLPLALLILLIASAMTVYVYSGGGQLDWAYTVRRLGDRVASQSQLWYLAVVEGFTWANFDSHQAVLNMQSLIENPAQEFVFLERLGPFYFIAKYAISSQYWSWVGNNGFVAPIMVWDGYLLELFGAVGLLLGTVLTAAIFGTNTAFLAAAIRSKNPYNAILPAHIYVQAYYLIVSGTPANLLGTGTMKAYAAMFSLQLLVQVWLNRTARRQILTTHPGHAQA